MRNDSDQALILDAPHLNSTVAITYPGSSISPWWGTSPPYYTSWPATVRILPYISGGSGEESDSGTGDGDATEGDDSDATSGDKGDGGTGDGGQKMLSQEQVNDIIAREVAKAQRGKLDPKELGFESGKELKEFLETSKKAADDAKSEAEKTLEKAVKEAADEARSTVLAQANERLVAAEFKLAAAKVGITAPDDALVLAKTMPLWSQVELSEEDGNVKVSGFDEAFFKELKDAKPFLFTSTSANSDVGAGAGAGGGTNKNSPEHLSELFPALKRAAAQVKQ